MSLIEVAKEMDRLLMDGVAIHPLSPIHRRLQQALSEGAPQDNPKPKALTDESPMPWGMHEGKPLGEVPPDYLLWLYENNKVNGHLKRYIADNLEVIKGQIANGAKGIK